MSISLRILFGLCFSCMILILPSCDSSPSSDKTIKKTAKPERLQKAAEKKEKAVVKQKEPASVKSLEETKKAKAPSDAVDVKGADIQKKASVPAVNPPKQERAQENAPVAENPKKDEVKSTVEKKATPAKSMAASADSKAQKPAAESQGVRVKVLSGTGALDTATELSVRVENAGYKVERVDLAMRSTFKRTAIYYAADQREEAKKMAGLLGEDCRLAPLSWTSVFDLIVVSGQNP